MEMEVGEGAFRRAVEPVLKKGHALVEWTMESREELEHTSLTLGTAVDESESEALSAQAMSDFEESHSVVRALLDKEMKRVMTESQSVFTYELGSALSLNTACAWHDVGCHAREVARKAREAKEAAERWVAEQARKAQEAAEAAAQWAAEQARKAWEAMVQWAHDTFVKPALELYEKAKMAVLWVVDKVKYAAKHLANIVAKINAIKEMIDNLIQFVKDMWSKIIDAFKLKPFAKRTLHFPAVSTDQVSCKGLIAWVKVTEGRDPILTGAGKLVSGRGMMCDADKELDKFQEATSNVEHLKNIKDAMANDAMILGQPQEARNDGIFSAPVCKHMESMSQSLVRQAVAEFRFELAKEATLEHS
jgi:hypothetical protein